MVRSKKILSATITACLCFTNLVYSAESVDSNNVTPSVSITFLDIEAAKAAIMDKKLDSYFGQLQPMEMSAKTGSPITGETLEEQRAQCRDRYRSEVREFSDDEKEAIRACVEKLYPVLLDKFPRFAELPWSFLKVSAKIEGGLPHTQDRHIILSEGICRQLMTRYESAPDQTVMSFAGLLLHEQMHVFQRANPKMFESLYTEIWGFVKAEDIASCPWLEENHLVNPDGPDCCWVFPIGQGKDITYILPLVVFVEGDGLKRMPGDFSMIALELVRKGVHFHPKIGDDGKPVHRNLFEMEEYRKAFPSIGNIYHPHEASASLFAMLAMEDLRSHDSSPPQADRIRNDRIPQKVREWFEENLATTPSQTNR